MKENVNYKSEKNIIVYDIKIHNLYEQLGNISKPGPSYCYKFYSFTVTDM